ncbi:MAG: T9SS type A sorting domain-containing protein [Ignavibacteriae bacterium]|nr:T9SS type A sorting domain-containing protein [Ignavibacteriota bacterium]
MEQVFQSAWNTGATPPGQPEGTSNFVHADVHFYAANPKDPNKIYIAADGGLYRTDNFGETFYSCNGGYVTSQFYASLGNSNLDSVFCLGGLQDNRSAFYQGTTAWYKTFSGDGACSQISSQSNSVCYTEYTYGSISSSNNGGVSWNGSAQGPPGNGNASSYCFNMPYVVCKTNPTILYAGGISMYKSTNSGSNWLLQYTFSGGKALSIAVSNTGTDTAYVGVIPGSSAAVFRTINGGTTWTDISGGIVPNRYPTRVHVNQYYSKEVYVTFGGFGTAHVLKSTNAGENWINITGNLPDVPTHSVAVDPVYPQNVYVGNDLGVYVSTNGGTNWYEYRSGMPYALVFDLTVVNVSRKLRATTHGNGIWERKLIANPVAVQNNNSEIPKEYKLYQNYPNPFNPVTTIKFDIPDLKGKSGYLKLDVYDLLGKKISSLVNENLTTGSYSVNFDASRFATGAYVYRLSVNNEVIATKKMLMIK